MALKLVWSRYISDEMISEFFFNFYGNLNRFKANMTPEEIKLFEATCFGHFLRMPKVIRSSKIIHSIMVRLGRYGIDTSDTLFFELGGQPRAFTKQHFADIMGLRVVENYKKFNYDGPEEKDGLYKKIFLYGKDKNRRVIASLVSEREKWTAEKRVRCLLLHFLYDVLLADSPNKSITNMAFIKMVDNLDEFNNYPWGNVVWDFLKERIHYHVMKRKKYNRMKPTKINIGSFIVALQIWAYECMPIFSDLKLCTKVSNTATPLMLRWEANTKISEIKVAKIPFHSAELVFNPIGYEVAELSRVVKKIKALEMSKIKDRVKAVETCYINIRSDFVSLREFVLSTFNDFEYQTGLREDVYMLYKRWTTNGQKVGRLVSGQKKTEEDNKEDAKDRDEKVDRKEDGSGEEGYPLSDPKEAASKEDVKVMHDWLNLGLKTGHKKLDHDSERKLVTHKRKKRIDSMEVSKSSEKVDNMCHQYQSKDVEHPLVSINSAEKDTVICPELKGEAEHQIPMPETEELQELSGRGKRRKKDSDDEDDNKNAESKKGGRPKSIAKRTLPAIGNPEESDFYHYETQTRLKKVAG